jgi:hypothetical protein
VGENRSINTYIKEERRNTGARGKREKQRETSTAFCILIVCEPASDCNFTCSLSLASKNLRPFLERRQKLDVSVL